MYLRKITLRILNLLAMFVCGPQPFNLYSWVLSFTLCCNLSLCVQITPLQRVENPCNCNASSAVRTLLHRERKLITWQLMLITWKALLMLTKFLMGVSRLYAVKRLVDQFVKLTDWGPNWNFTIRSMIVGPLPLKVYHSNAEIFLFYSLIAWCSLSVSFAWGCSISYRCSSLAAAWGSRCCHLKWTIWDISAIIIISGKCTSVILKLYRSVVTWLSQVCFAAVMLSSCFLYCWTRTSLVHHNWNALWSSFCDLKRTLVL